MIHALEKALLAKEDLDDAMERISELNKEHKDMHALGDIMKRVVRARVTLFGPRYVNQDRMCFGPSCTKKLSFRGYCSIECHDKYYDELTEMHTPVVEEDEKKE